MPRQASNRSNRSRGAPRRNIAVRRAIKRARTAPLARIRPKTVLRGRGNATASITTNRKFVSVPRHIKADGKADSKWWIEGLKWLGTVVMKVLTIAVTTADLENFLRSNPLPVDHPFAGRLLAGSIPVGTIIRLAFGAEDLVGDSDFIVPGAGDKPPNGTGHYRQARIEWIRVIINPITSIKDKSGMIAAAIIPVTPTQVQNDLAVRKTEAHDMKELLRTPGVVFKTASTPTSVTYSPQPSHHAYNWSDFGSQTDTNPPGGMEIGGSVCIYLDIGYTNMATDTTDMTSEYSMSAATFDITVESRVHMREYDEGVITRIIPWTLTNSQTIGVREYNKSYSVPLDRTLSHRGIFLFERDIDDFCM